jgi:hypothetical protein
VGEQQLVAGKGDGDETGQAVQVEPHRALLHAGPILVVVVVEQDEAARLGELHGDLQVVDRVLGPVTAVDAEEREAAAGRVADFFDVACGYGHAVYLPDLHLGGLHARGFQVLLEDLEVAPGAAAQIELGQVEDIEGEVRPVGVLGQGEGGEELAEHHADLSDRAGDAFSFLPLVERLQRVPDVGVGIPSDLLEVTRQIAGDFWIDHWIPPKGNSDTSRSPTAPDRVPLPCVSSQEGPSGKRMSLLGF